MIYLDSNVFVYAATDDGAKGTAATKILRKAIADGACTSSLTLDEVLWAVREKLGRDRAADQARKLLALDVEVTSVEKRDIETAIAHFEGGLDPRDAIHVAVALRRGCTAIASSDDAFAAIKGLRHISY